MEMYTKPKHEFAVSLRPFFDMLTVRRDELTEQEWLNLVNRTRVAVTNAPDQYIGKDLPGPAVTADLIHKIFEDYLSEMLILESATVSS